MQSLFNAILPSEGHGFYCTVGIKKPSLVLHNFADSLSDLEHKAVEFHSKRLNVYYALASFSTKEDGRKAENVSYLKAIWVDIDTRETPSHKDSIYADRSEAAVALRKFVIDAGLPDPWVVDSGGGLHVYWPLETEIERSVWLPIAHGLNELCKEFGLEVGTECTADAARILRVPGTTNLNTHNTVAIIAQATRPLNVIEVAGIRDKGVKNTPPSKLNLGPRRELDETTKALLNNRETKFSIIVKRSFKGEGCEHIKQIVEDQVNVPEPLWRAGLSVAWSCDDGKTAIHKMSMDHPAYDEGETLAKAEKTKGPYTCATFETISPGICQNCPHKDKITSPIQLGIVIEKAEAGTEVAAFNEIGQEVSYKVPQLPWPYFRGKNGGIYKEKGQDEDKDVCIYEHDLFINQRLYEPGMGELAWMNIHLPRDGLRQLTTPVGDLFAKDKCRDLLASNGVFASNKQMDGIMAYLTRVLKDLQMNVKALHAHTRFGWSENFESFLVGDLEITATGMRYSPPSVQTRDLVHLFRPVGTLEKWKEIINTWTRPGLEPHAFAFLSGFGSPLYTFTGHHGLLINLYNPKGGTGKTTILQAANSLFGHPQDLLTIEKDTVNARIHRLGVLGNICGTMDELTNMLPQQVSDMLYNLSHGRGKNRMQSQTNAERINNTKWSMICLGTSNHPLFDKLRQLKESPDGESLRLLEYMILPSHNLPKVEADVIFKNLLFNYGHAGPIYMQWVVANRDKAVAEQIKWQRKVDKELSFTGRERFWSAGTASILAGGNIARELGLIEFNMRNIYDFAVQNLHDHKHNVVEPNKNSTNVLGNFLNELHNNVLIINDVNKFSSGLPEAPIREPKGPLLVRIEPDTKRIYVSTKAIREYCTRQQISYKDFTASLAQEKVLLQSTKKRLSKGTHMPTPAIDVLEIDAVVAGLDIPENPPA